MFDQEFVKWAISLGVGGILAAFIFSFYRKDIKLYTELWKTVSEQLITVIKENTASNVELIHLIKSQERNSLRRTDIALIRDHIQLEETRTHSSRATDARQ